MKNGKTIILLGSCLMVLIIFSTLIQPSLSATYTVTSTTRTTTRYYGPSGFIPPDLSSDPSSDESEVTSVSSSLSNSSQNTLLIESSAPSSEPWWMKPYSSSSTSTSVFSSIPESADIAEISSTDSSLITKSSKVSEIIESSALSSVITAAASVKSSNELFTVSNAAAEPSETAPNLVSYWWILLIALVLILSGILVFKKEPNQK